MVQPTTMTGLRRVVSERALVRRARDGDRRSFHELVRRNNSHIYSITLAALQTPELAERVILETFADALAALPRLKDGEPFSPWLVKLNGRQIMCCVPPQNEREPLPPGPHFTKAGELAGAQAEWGEGEPQADSALRQVITAAVASLPAAHRAELVLCDLGRLSCSEIAVASGTTAKAVKRNIHEARVCMVVAIETHFRRAPRAAAR